MIDLQRFSLHDGDGIRTTVFFKGCPLSCEWCHNPEGQRFEREWMFYRDRCIGCGRCRAGELTEDTCPSGARELVGRAYALGELMRLLTRDRQCYEVSGGGVTLSGGEVMAQDIDYIVALMRRLQREGIPVNIDTCGLAPWSAFERVLPYADTFLYDIKAMDPAVHARYTGVDNAQILDNLKRLSAAGARINIRIPVIPGVNDTPEEVRAMIEFVRAHAKAVRVSLLPYHRLGSDKCERLEGHMAHEFEVPSNEHMEELAGQWRAAGFADVRIGG